MTKPTKSRARPAVSTALVMLECGRVVSVRCTFEVVDVLGCRKRGKRVMLDGAKVQTFEAQRVKAGKEYAVALPFRVRLPDPAK